VLKIANQIVEIVQSSGFQLPTLGGMFSGLIGFLLFIFIAAGLSITTWVIMNKMSYNKKIVIFELVGNKFEPTRKDTAKEITIGQGGERVLFLKKHKLWKVAEKQASRNTYWFAIGSDGYWYNFVMENLNLRIGTSEIGGINPEMHKIMRYQNAALRKNLQERHIKKKWFEHPIVGWIGAIIFVLVVGIMFMMIGKYYFAELPNTLQLLNQILEKQAVLLDKVANLAGG